MNYDAFSKSDRKKFLKLTLAQLRLESAANARLVPTFTLAEGSSSSIEELDREEGLGINETVTPAL